MPKCKNDPNRRYKGSEPSPKGKGYCAHTMDVGDRKRGNDKKYWIVRKTKSGKRWFRDKRTNHAILGQRIRRFIKARGMTGFSVHIIDQRVKVYENYKINKCGISYFNNSWTGQAFLDEFK